MCESAAVTTVTASCMCSKLTLLVKEDGAMLFILTKSRTQRHFCTVACRIVTPWLHYNHYFYAFFFFSTVSPELRSGLKYVYICINNF